MGRSAGGCAGGWDRPRKSSKQASKQGVGAEGWMQACARGFQANTPLGPSPAMRRVQIELSGAVQCSAANTALSSVFGGCWAAVLVYAGSAGARGRGGSQRVEGRRRQSMGAERSVLQAAGRSKARGCWGLAGSGAINSPAKARCWRRRKERYRLGGLSRFDLIRHKRSSEKMAVQQQQRWGRRRRRDGA